MLPLRPGPGLACEHADAAVRHRSGSVPRRTDHRLRRVGAAEPENGADQSPRGAAQRIFLIVVGLLWPHVDLPRGWETAAAALWGAGGPMMPLAASDRVGSAAQGAVVQAGLTTLAIADVLGVAIVLWGILIS